MPIIESNKQLGEVQSLFLFYVIHDCALIVVRTLMHKAVYCMLEPFYVHLVVNVFQFIVKP